MGVLKEIEHEGKRYAVRLQGTSPPRGGIDECRVHTFDLTHNGQVWIIHAALSNNGWTRAESLEPTSDEVVAFYLNEIERDISGILATSDAYTLHKSEEGFATFLRARRR